MGDLILEWLNAVSSGIVSVFEDVALKGSLVLLLALALVRLLRSSSAAMRHLVLLLAVLSVLFIPVFSLSLPKLSVLPPLNTSGDPAKGKARSLEAPGEVGDNVSQGAEQPPGGRTAAPSARIGSNRLGWPARAVAVWLLVAGVLGARVSLGSLHVRRIAAGAIALDEREWLGLARLPGWLRVELRYSQFEIMPMALGVLRARVLLPRSANGWPEEQRRAVLLHEIAHLVRLDPLTQALTRSACTLFWFNPLVWLVAKRLTEEQEKACDDLAAARLGSATDYAGHLVQVVASLGSEASGPQPAAAFAKRSTLEHRVRSVLDTSLDRKGVRPGVLVFSICLALSVIAPLSMLDSRQDPMGRSALHIAARAGNARSVTRMLERGFDLRVADNEGRTPLHLAASNGREEAVAVLLDAGGDISARDDEGRTPLHLASRNGHTHAVELLLKAGGEVHTLDFEGRTPLESASVIGDQRLVNLLIEAASQSAPSS